MGKIQGLSRIVVVNLMILDAYNLFCIYLGNTKKTAIKAGTKILILLK